MTEHLNLAALRENLAAAIVDGSLRLTPGAPAAIERLGALTRVLPKRELRLNGCLVEDGPLHLTVAGDLAVTWPVRGSGDLRLELSRASIRYTEREGRLSADLALDGWLRCGGTRVAMRGAWGPGPQIVFTSASAPTLSLEVVGRLAGGDTLVRSLPEQLGSFDVLALGWLSLTLDLALSGQAKVELGAELTPRWVVADGLAAIERVGLRVESSYRVVRGVGARNSQRVSLYGRLKLGSDFDVRASLVSDGALEIEVLPLDGNLLPSAEALAELVGGRPLAEGLRDGFERIGLGSIALARAALVVDLRAKRVRYAEVGASVEIDGTRFLCLVALPSLSLHGRLDPATPLSLRGLVAKHFAGAEAFPDVRLAGLTIAATPSRGEYALSAAFRSDLEMPVGDLSLVFTRFDFDVERRTDGITGSVSAAFDVAGTEIELSAAHPQAGGGWVFAGNSTPNSPIPMTALLRSLGNVLSVELPPQLPDVSFQNIAFSLDTGSRAFSFRSEAAASFPLMLGGRALASRLSLELASEVGEDGKRTFEGFIRGELDVGPAALELGLELAGPNRELKGGLREGQSVTLRELVAPFLPEGAELPPEVPGDVALKALAFTLRSDRTYRLTAAIADLRLPFALGESALTLDKLEVTVEGDAARLTKLDIGLEAHGQISTDLKFPKLGLSFAYEKSGQWKLDGLVHAQVLDHLFKLGARYTEADKTRKLELFYEHAPAEAAKPLRPLVEIPGFASFDVRRLAFELESGREKRAWKVSATTDLHVFHELAGERQTIFRLEEGTLALHDEKGPRDRTQGLEFTAKSARTGRIPLFSYPTYRETNPQRGPAEAPAYEETGTKSFAFDARFDKASLTRKNGRWGFSASAGLGFYDAPPPLDAFFARSIDGRFSVDSGEARFTISRLVEDLPISFPDIPTGDGERTIPLGKGVLNLRDIGVTLGREAALTADIVVGLPSKLNNFFGVDEAGKPRHELFRTWAEGGTETERDESLVRLSLRVGTDGVGGALKTSPVRAFPVEDGHIVLDWTDAKDVGTDKDFGRFSLQVPTFQLDLKQGSLKFAGGFKIDGKRGLRLPLTPLKSLVRLVAQTGNSRGADDLFHRALEALPNSIPLTGLAIFDEESGELDVAGIEKVLGVKLPKELRDAVESVKDVADRLPDRFKHYLNFQLPTDLNFAIDVTPDGGVRFNVRTQGSPLKLLLPLGPTNLAGVELSSLSFGTLFGGALLVADASLRVDMFSTLEIAAGLLIPPEVARDRLASSRQLRQTFICDELLLFIVYQSGVPIPIPVFFNELGVSGMSLAGIEVQSHFYFPRPVFKKERALALLRDLVAFFSKEDHYLDVDFPPPKPNEGDLNLVFTVGPQYLALPPIFGATEKTTSREDYRAFHYPVGFETVRQDAATRTVRLGHVVGFDADVFRVDTLRLLFILLNAVKKRSPTYLLHRLSKELPLERRLGFFDLSFFELFLVQAAWAVTTPQEFVERASALLGERFEQNYREKTGRTLRATRDTKELLALMPAQAALAPAPPGGREPAVSPDDEGLVVFVRGAVAVGDALTLEAAFGLALTDGTGFGTGVMFRGELAEVFLLELKGLVKVAPPRAGEAPRGADVVRVAGKAGLVLLGQNVLDGFFDLQLRDDGRFRFRIRGMLDLFPPKLFPDFPLRIYSGKRRDLVRSEEDRYIVGDLDHERCDFQGEVHFEFGVLQLSGFAYIQSGRAASGGRASEARLELTMLGATLSLRLHEEGTRFLLAGSATRMQALGGLLSITDADGAGGPRASLVVVNQKLESFTVTGAASLLGLGSSRTEIVVTPEKMSFDLRNTLDLPGLHGELVLESTLVPGQSFAGDSTFDLRLDLGELLATVVKQVTRLSFPKIDLTTGVRIDLRVRASQAVSEDEATYRARRAAYERQEAERQRLKAEGERAIAEASALRASAEKQRKAGLQRIRESEQAVQDARSQIAWLESELAALQQEMATLPADAPLEAYEAKLRAWTDRIHRLGDEMAAHERVIADEEARFQAQLVRIAQGLRDLRRQMDELAGGGRDDEFNRLAEVKTRLEAERAVYNRKVVLIAEARGTRPLEDNARVGLARAEARRSEAERAVNLDAEYRRVFGQVDQYLERLHERAALESRAERVLPALGQDATSLAFAEALPRRSHLEVAVTTRLFFLGFAVELPFRLVLDDLESVDWKSHAVLGRLAVVVVQQLADNAIALLARAAGGFAALARHLVRIVFDAGYRHEQLTRGADAFATTVAAVPVDASREQQVLVPVGDGDPAELAARLARQQAVQGLIIERLRNGQGTSRTDIRACLEQVGWSADEVASVLGVENAQEEAGAGGARRAS